MTAPLRSTPTRGQRPEDRRLRLAGLPQEVPSAVGAAHARLDRILQLLDRRPLYPTEVRVLLALVERDATVGQLAEQLAKDAEQVAEVGRRLVARRMVRQRRSDDDRQTVLGLSLAGFREIRPLVTAAAIEAEVATS